MNDWYKKAKLIDKGEGNTGEDKNMYLSCQYCGRWATNPTDEKAPSTHYLWKKPEQLDSEEKKESDEAVFQMMESEDITKSISHAICPVCWDLLKAQGFQIRVKNDLLNFKSRSLAIGSTNSKWHFAREVKTSMANRWIPQINDPESQLEYLFDCTSVQQNSWQMELIECMDNNNDWQPNEKTQRYLEKHVGALEDDYALRFKYCLYKGLPYIAAYFSAIHYVFRVRR